MFFNLYDHYYTIWLASFYGWEKKVIVVKHSDKYHNFYYDFNPFPFHCKILHTLRWGIPIILSGCLGFSSKELLREIIRFKNKGDRWKELYSERQRRKIGIQKGVTDHLQRKSGPSERKHDREEIVTFWTFL